MWLFYVDMERYFGRIRMSLKVYVWERVLGKGLYKFRDVLIFLMYKCFK